MNSEQEKLLEKSIWWIKCLQTNNILSSDQIYQSYQIGWSEHLVRWFKEE